MGSDVVNELIDQYIGSHNSAETRSAYRKDMKRWLDFGGTDRTTMDEAIRFREYLEGIDIAPKTKARAWSTVKNFFRFMEGVRHAYGENPFVYIKGPRAPKNVAPKVPDDEDVQAVLSVARQSSRQHRVLSLLLNGLRANEVCSLTPADVEIHEGRVFLRVVGKGMKERLIPATDEVLQSIAQVSTAHDKWMVADYDGSQLNTRQIREDVYHCAEKAGVTGMHPHALRHHYATRMYRAGVDLAVIQRLLGHADIRTTMVYLTLDLKKVAAAADLDPMNFKPTQLEVLSA